MRILTFTSLAIACSVASADRCRPTTTCCPQPVCSAPSAPATSEISSCGSGTSGAISYGSGPTTKLFMTKTGEIREVMTHWAALHRAVEADGLEEELVTVRTELQASQQELTALKEQSATQVAALQQELKTLRQQMGQQTKVAANQNARAKKVLAAEKAAQKAAADQAASLKKAGEEAARKAQEAMTLVQTNLKQTSEERDSLKAANEKLQKEVKRMVAARTKAEEEFKAAKIEIQKMKQEAIEAKKTQVAQKEEEQAEDAPPAEDADKPAEDPAEEEPATDESKLRISLN